MTSSLVAGLTLLTLGAIARPVGAQTDSPGAARASNVVHVAPPTGAQDADRASIVAALERARPGDTVQFARGVYLVGRLIPVSTPRLTLLGHPEGSTLRGCDPATLDTLERELVRAMQSRDTASAASVVKSCGMFQLSGGHTTVRNLVFEYTRLGLMLGCCELEGVTRPDDGAYRIEDNTFRSSSNGIRPGIASSEPTVIRGNRFVNVFHAVSAAASHLHVLDNHISAPQPERVPALGHPSFAIALGGSRNPRAAPTVRLCEFNIIEGNRIEGHPDGILIIAPPGTSCRNNVIRDNTILVRRVRLPSVRPVPNAVEVTDEADSTIVGVPLALESPPRPPGQPDDPAAEGMFQDNLIEGNHLIGADGLGLIINRGSRNRIVNNSITGISRRDPFPGNTLAFPPARWREANGSGIWVSPGSEGNEITGNTFEDIAGHAIVLAGDRNVVETRSASDSVHDVGTGNRVTRAQRVPIGAQTQPGNTLRWVIPAARQPVGQRMGHIPGIGDSSLTGPIAGIAGRIWFAKPGGDGDGASPARPLGSTTAIEDASEPGDIIILLPGDVAFDGGLALKPRQTLVGHRDGERRPAITNASAVPNGGNGIVLADSVRVWNVRVENTHASGIYGADVVGVTISGVEVVGANRGASRTVAILRLFETLCREVPVPLGVCAPLPHGGIVLLSSRPGLASTTLITESAVLDAAGIGIGTIAWAGAHQRLVVTNSRIEGGADVGGHDYGVMGMAEGGSSDVRVELNGVRVLGRTTGRSGRNVIVYASAEATATAWVDGSYIGAAGQDGVIAVAGLLPASAELAIRGSTIENAAQTNVEGTLLALPPIDSARVSESRISIHITGSTVRGAGAVPGFEQSASNILLVASPLTREPQPLPRGRYLLTVLNSTIEGAARFGLRIGSSGSRAGAADASAFDILLRESTVAGNGAAELSLGAANVRIDARQNCWGSAAGLDESRVLRSEAAADARIDASGPLPCTGIRSRPR